MMKWSTPSCTVARRDLTLITPAKPTPRHLKPLSDIDDQHFLRMYPCFMLIYPGGKSGSDDPVKVIKEALAEALVYYYPFAGRLREGIGGKLSVDCSGEGVVFVEADADICIEGLGGKDGVFCPPFPSELLPLVGSSSFLDCPLLMFQVTRLKCGGFVLGMSVNHTMTDGAGLAQFLNATGQLARGASHPSIIPVWRRELLECRVPPRITFSHREYDELEGTAFPKRYTDEPIVQRSFFFGSAVMSALRRPNVTQSSTYELLAAFLWRCRTVALRFEPGEEVRFLCILSFTRLLKSPPLPPGYYGNTLVIPAAVTTAEELCRNTLDYAVKLIKKSKAEVNEEYVRSATDLLATRGRPHHTLQGSWLLSDNTRAGYEEVDFGWGKPVFGGPCSAMVGAVVAGQDSALVRGRNEKGESGVTLLICLPETAMERFAEEVESVVGNFDVISKL